MVRCTDFMKMTTCKRRALASPPTARALAHLIELERVEQLDQFAILLVLFELDIMLLETVKRELGIVINVNFHRLQAGG